jgi:hypothetical protein
VKQKTFYKTFLEINQNPKKTKQILLDKRLTSTEKKILEGYFLIRDNRNNEALVLLKGLTPSEFEFVEAQRKLFIGVSLNNLSHFSEAEESICEALTIFTKIKSNYFIFLGHFNLYFIYFNTRQLEKMKDTILAMETIPLETDLQEIRKLRCIFNYYSEINDSEKALAILKLLEPRKIAMPESDAISHLVFEFMFYSKDERFDECGRILTEMKKFRKFHLSENFNYMKKLLDHLTHDGPLYAYQEEFSGVPILFHQIKVIQALEEKNLDLARTHWNILKTLHPNMFSDNFIYIGTKCLFSICLEKHHQKLEDPIQFKSEAPMTKIDKLVLLLTKAKAPLPSAYIYEMLWGELPNTKDDMIKLGRLIYRAKLERKINIQFRKGTYRLISDPITEVRKKPA